MAWVITSNGMVGFQAITAVETTQKHPFGTIVAAYDPVYGGGEFMYVKGVSNGAEKAWVTYNADAGTTTLLAANAIGPVGIMMSTLDAATDFGWIQISGKALGQCLTGYADNAAVFSTSTGGAVDDTSVAGDLVYIAKGASAVLNTGSTPLYAEFEISRPFALDRSGNT